MFKMCKTYEILIMRKMCEMCKMCKTNDEQSCESNAEDKKGQDTRGRKLEKYSVQFTSDFSPSLWSLSGNQCFAGYSLSLCLYCYARLQGTLLGSKDLFTCFFPFQPH